jgi:hypothetical protein
VLVACAGSSGDEDDGSYGGGSSRRQRCVSLCDRMQAVGCANFDHGSCIHGCVDADDATTGDGQCAATYDAVLSCATRVSDVCTLVIDPESSVAEPACSDETVDYADCLVAYCTAHPNEDYCS